MAHTGYHCPGCDAEQPIPLLAPPPLLFTCPQCNLTQLRANLIRRNTLRTTLGGGVSAGIGVSAVATGSFFDATQLTTTFASGAFTFSPGQIVVACISHNGTDDSIQTIGTVDVNGTSPLTILSGTGTALSQWGEMFFLAPVDDVHTGSAVVNVGFSSGVNPLSAALVVLILSGAKATTQPDRAKNAKGTSAAASSGASAALREPNEVVIAMIAYNDEGPSVINPPSWLGGYTPVTTVGTTAASAGFDTSVSVAKFYPTTLTAQTAAATLVNPVAWVAQLGAFKRA